MPRRYRNPLTIPKITAATSRRRVSLVIGILILILCVVAFGAFRILPSRWDSKDRFVLATISKNGSVDVAVFDPAGKQVVRLAIPDNTQVDVAHELGKWKMGSVAKLGENEKLPGVLVKETIEKTFSIPIDGWIQEKSSSILSDNFVDIIKSVFTPPRTSLSLKERIQLAFFSMRTKISQKYNIDLVDEGYLQSTILKDGEDGYVPRKSLPPKIQTLFVDHAISSQQPRISIIDATGGSGVIVANNIIESLGTKVVAVKDAPSQNMDCEVESLQNSASRLTSVMGCSRKISAPEGNYDIQVLLGSFFAKRF